MSEDKKLRTFDDLLRVVRALAYEFKTDTVWISRVPAEFQNESTAWWPSRPSRRRLTKWFPAVACQLSSGGIDAYN